MIKCKNLEKVYKNGDNETWALKGVSFEIKKGEFIAIMGPSGSGKSTLMHIIGALDSPTKGEYLLEGKDVAKLSDDQLAEIRNNKIGFVFQAFNLLSRATVIRNVMLPLLYNKIAKKKRMERVEESLNAVNLAHNRWDHLSNQLSGGQIQRVAIARALVNHPSLILADEPTGNLDTKTGDMVMDTFRRLNREEGHTIVLITHEPEIAEHADRIIHVRDGVIEKDEIVKK